MKKSIIDMHVHSRTSDGSLSEMELADVAFNTGLKGVSLTNHDTLLGQTEFKQLAAERGIETITGIEVSSAYLGRAVHILGYGVDPSKETLLIEYLQPTWNILNESVMTLVQRAKDAGIALPKSADNIGEIKRLTGTLSHYVSFNSLFDWMQAATHLAVPHLWNLLFVDKSDFWSLMTKPGILSPVEAIRLINRLGGKSVLAHPGTICLRSNAKDDNEDIVQDIIFLLLRNGLDGLEVYYPKHTREQTLMFQSIAKKYDLIMTSGSDFHGAYTRNLSLGASSGLSFKDFLNLKNYCES